MQKICSDGGWMQWWTLFGLQAPTCGRAFGRETSESKMQYLHTGWVGWVLGGGVYHIRDATILNDQCGFIGDGLIVPLSPYSLSPLPLLHPPHPPPPSSSPVMRPRPLFIHLLFADHSPVRERKREWSALRFSYWKMNLSSPPLLQHYLSRHRHTCCLRHSGSLHRERYNRSPFREIRPPPPRPPYLLLANKNLGGSCIVIIDSSTSITDSLFKENSTGHHF